MKTADNAKQALRQINTQVKEHFATNKRVLSFDEYLTLFAEDPRRHARNTAQFLLDMLDHYGTEEVKHPGGTIRRFKLFDAPWDDGEVGLVGQEPVQNAIYRILYNFVRQRRIDRFLLLHGPNGSSKSTVTEMLQRAMEHYSSLDAGALYRFNWMFPTRTPGRKGIGFHRSADSDSGESFARLDETEIDARLPCEMRDHPLLLIPKRERQRLLDQWLGAFDRGKVAGDGQEFLLADYIAHGDLCQKCKMIYEALLSAYDGDYLQVLRHVQVERFYVSRRYRISAGRVEPQLAVDARARQITADSSLGALPAALQNSALHDTAGELVDANRGVLDFADLLKRQPEAYKYLLTTVESGRVVLDAVNLFVDLLFIGSANENRLNAFMESPEWTSFKARMELVRVPYLRDHVREREIYERQVTEEQLGKHIAPHAIPVATLWAVLTRMHPPDGASFEDSALKEIVGKLGPLDKAEFYAGRMPSDLSDDQTKVLRGARREVFDETAASLIYEGRTGASPREIKALLLNAAQEHDYDCVTPEAVLKRIGALVEEKTVYAFLRQEKQAHDYFDHGGFVDLVRDWYLRRADDDVRAAMGLVEEASYEDLFGRYMNHLTHHVRKEQLLNPVTGDYEDPDKKLMGEVEKSLEVEGDAEEFRQGVMTRIGAWSVDNPGEMPNYTTIFPEHFTTLRKEYYAQQRQRVSRILSDALKVLVEEGASLTPDDLRTVEQMLARLKKEYGYCDHCIRETLTMLARTRYSD